MKFGVREICDVVFKALQTQQFGDITVAKGQPVLYIDSAKTSTIEGASSTVYATGGRGNARLIAWEGEKTLTFTVEDALLSPIGFAVLSGAGLIDLTASENIMVHCTQVDETDASGNINLDKTPAAGAPLFVVSYDADSVGKKLIAEGSGKAYAIKDGETAFANKKVFVDYYTAATTEVTELQIDAENFAGFYYVEASTLFRRESDGKDLPAEIVFPKVKIQSNFTFNMAATGDPSTFTFTMDALPAYTMFDKKKKVLCAIQVIHDTEEAVAERASVLDLGEGEKASLDGEIKDSTTTE